MQGYCVRCKAKQEMLAATRTVLRNGRRAMIGQCASCATKIHVIGVWDDDPLPAEVVFAGPFPKSGREEGTPGIGRPSAKKIGLEI